MSTLEEVLGCTSLETNLAKLFAAIALKDKQGDVRKDSKALKLQRIPGDKTKRRNAPVVPNGQQLQRISVSGVPSGTRDTLRR